MQYIKYVRRMSFITDNASQHIAVLSFLRCSPGPYFQPPGNTFMARALIDGRIGTRGRMNIYSSIWCYCYSLHRNEAHRKRGGMSGRRWPQKYANPSIVVVIRLAR